MDNKIQERTAYHNLQGRSRWLCSRYHQGYGRVEADGQNNLPSLRKVPAFEDSNDVNATTTSEESRHTACRPTSTLQSSPHHPLIGPSSQNKIRLQSSTSTSTRFAQSSPAASVGLGRDSPRPLGAFPSARRHRYLRSDPEISFDDVSAIPSYPQPGVAGVDEQMVRTVWVTTCPWRTHCDHPTVVALHFR